MLVPEAVSLITLFAMSRYRVLNGRVAMGVARRLEVMVSSLWLTQQSSLAIP